MIRRYRPRPTLLQTVLAIFALGAADAVVHATTDWHKREGRPQSAMRSDGGFTLLEIIIVVAVLGIILIGVIFGMQGCNKAGAEATQDAIKFGKNMGENITGVECVKYDSDNDGYVSCTLFLRDKQPMAVDCAAHSIMSWRNSGCRLQKPVLRR